jgi:hypothetical protein
MTKHQILKLAVECQHAVNIPTDVGEEEKKALEQTSDDAISGW